MRGGISFTNQGICVLFFKGGGYQQPGETVGHRQILANRVVASRKTKKNTIKERQTNTSPYLLLW